MKTLVFLPTYNEKENIERMVEAVLALGSHPVLDSLGITEIGILVVDDSSPDGTGEIAESLVQKYPGRVSVIHRAERGRGTAGMAGFTQALKQGADYIIEMDADFSHDPQAIPSLLAEIKNYDIVIGSRYLPGSMVGPRSIFRRFTSWGAGVYTRRVLGIDIKDWSSGYKCYRRQALESLNFAEVRSAGYSVGMETLYHLIKGGLSYKEIPIKFVDRARGKSKFSSKESLDYLKVAWRLGASRK